MPVALAQRRTWIVPFSVVVAPLHERLMLEVPDPALDMVDELISPLTYITRVVVPETIGTLPEIEALLGVLKN